MAYDGVPETPFLVIGSGCFVSVFVFIDNNPVELCSVLLNTTAREEVKQISSGSPMGVEVTSYAESTNPRIVRSRRYRLDILDLILEYPKARLELKREVYTVKAVDLFTRLYYSLESLDNKLTVRFAQTDTQGFFVHYLRESSYVPLDTALIQSVVVLQNTFIVATEDEIAEYVHLNQWVGSSSREPRKNILFVNSHFAVDRKITAVTSWNKAQDILVGFSNGDVVLVSNREQIILRQFKDSVLTLGIWSGYAIVATRSKHHLVLVANLSSDLSSTTEITSQPLVSDSPPMPITSKIHTSRVVVQHRANISKKRNFPQAVPSTRLFRKLSFQRMY